MNCKKPRIYKIFTHNGEMLFVAGWSCFFSKREKELWEMAQKFCDSQNKRNFLRVSL